MVVLGYASVCRRARGHVRVNQAPFPAPGQSGIEYRSIPLFDCFGCCSVGPFDCLGKASREMGNTGHKDTRTLPNSNTHDPSHATRHTDTHQLCTYARGRQKSPVETWTRRTITKRRCSLTPKPSTELKDSSRATRQRVGTGARRSAAQPHPNKIGPAGAPASPPAALVVVDGLYGC